MAVYRHGKWTYTQNDRDFLVIAVRELKQKEFRIIRMRLVELYTIEEIANRLGMEWAAVDRAIDEAVKNLRRAFFRVKSLNESEGRPWVEHSKFYTPAQLAAELVS